MTTAEIFAAVESLTHGASFVAACSGGETRVTFAAFTGAGRQVVQASSNNQSLAAGIEEAFADLQAKLDGN